MGRIVELKIGHDGLCRSAVLALPRNKRVTRAIRHLYPIEEPLDELCDGETQQSPADEVPEREPTERFTPSARHKSSSPEDDHVEEEDVQSSSRCSSKRPRRQAALAARQAIKTQCQNDDEYE
jgi:hypothetical protein